MCDFVMTLGLPTVFFAVGWWGNKRRSLDSEGGVKAESERLELRSVFSHRHLPDLSRFFCIESGDKIQLCIFDAIDARCATSLMDSGTVNARSRRLMRVFYRAMGNSTTSMNTLTARRNVCH